MKRVIIYTTSRCPFCSMAKAFLAQKGVPFEEKNVERDRAAAEEMVRKSGQYGVPVIEIDGDIIVGFNPQLIERMLREG